MPFGHFILVKAFATQIVVTLGRLVKGSGLPSFQPEHRSLDKVEKIELHESILGALRNYGTVDVRGTGTGSIGVEMVQSRSAIRLPKAA